MILIKQRPGIDSEAPLMERLYQARGALWHGREAFSLAKLLSPNLKGLDQACQLLVTALEKRHKVLVVGDYDADGVTSTVLCLQVLGALGLTVDYVIPSRFDFGYGLTTELVQYIADNCKADILLTVDNGIASVAAVAMAQKLGMKVIVTDHHLPGANLPNADAIINPNQPDCPFPSKAASGCTVAFYFVLGLVRRLENTCGTMSTGSRVKAQEVLAHLDLVALATIADVVPLDSNNRLLVEQGLRRIRAGKARPGIYALIAVAGKDYRELSAEDLGFAIAPRLNAAGRMEDMSKGVECLIADSYEEALEHARELDSLNSERRLVEASMKQEAEVIVERLHLSPSKLPKSFCLYNPSWHQGVIGLVAGRIKETYHRPVIAFAASHEPEQLKGSARSIPGIHIRDVLERIANKHPDMLQKYGGHAMAAGLSLKEQDVASFTIAFEKQVAEIADPSCLEKNIHTDGPLKRHELTFDQALQLKLLSPWGKEFPEPVFDNWVEIEKSWCLKNQHLKMLVVLDGQPVDAIYFNAPKKWLLDLPTGKCHIAYQAVPNRFRGEAKLQLLIKTLI